MAFNAPPAVMNGIMILCSWSPAIVLLLVLGKLKPGMTIARFYKQAFREKIQVSLLAVITVLYVAAVLVLLGLFRKFPVRVDKTA